MNLGKVELARNSIDRFMGLMFRKRIEKPMILELEYETKMLASIHMLFMNFPIDVVFLDSKKKVVDLKKNVQPWILNLTPKKPARYVVEMKAGSAKCKVGDKVNWS